MRRLSDLIALITRRHRSVYVTEDDVSVTSLSSTPSQARHVSSDDAREDLPHVKAEDPGSGSPAAPKMEACLGIFDLVSLGVGSCLGTGMYLTVGIVASTIAGPGGVVSFLLAGLASILTGLCYSELSGRCPKSSGSAYMYAYVTAGELAAFVIGWGLVVEYVIGTAAGASALSETLDSICSGIFSASLKTVATVLGLPKVDAVAAVICLLLTWLLASGAQMSAKVNNALNLTNFIVLIVFVVASVCLGSLGNWRAAGFFPMGLSGVVAAIPTCYYAFIGFDGLAATGAEARDPATSIPISILLSILLSCLAYVIVILALTFDLPFYLLRSHTAMTDVFPQVNFTPGKYVISVGALTGEFAATFGSLFPLPRVIMSMASDGLIFRQLSRVCPSRHTPVRATVLSGLVAMVMATFFRLTILIELVLIGTLLAYVLVTFALLHIRYVHLDSPLSSGGADRAACAPTMGLPKDASPLTQEQRQQCSSVEDPHAPVVSLETTRPQQEMTEIVLPSKAQSSLDSSLPGSTAECGDSCAHHRNRAGSDPRKKHAPIPRRLESPSFWKEGRRSSVNESSSDSEVSNPGRDSVDENNSLTRSDHRSPSNQTGRKFVLSRLFSFWRSHAENRKTYEALPLLEMNATDDSFSDTEDTLFEKSSANTGPNEKRKGRQRTSHGDLHHTTSLWGCHQSGHSGARKPSLWKQCMGNKRRNGRIVRRSAAPLLVRVVGGFADDVAASPTKVRALLCAVYGLLVLLCLLLSSLWKNMAAGSVLSLSILGLLSLILCTLVGILTLLPESVSNNSFRAPLVPTLPVLVAMLNIFLMTSLSLVTWGLFALWMSAGLLVYGLYGVKNSEASLTSSMPVTSSAAPSSESRPVSTLLEKECDDSTTPLPD